MYLVGELLRDAFLHPLFESQVQYTITGNNYQYLWETFLRFFLKAMTRTKIQLTTTSSKRMLAVSSAFRDGDDFVAAACQRCANLIVADVARHLHRCLVAMEIDFRGRAIDVIEQHFDAVLAVAARHA